MNSETPGPAEFALLLKEVFGDSADLPPDCLIPSLCKQAPVVLNEAVESIGTGGARGVLIERLKDVHPIGEEHRREFDTRLGDVIALAEAYAWLRETSPFGTPEFVWKPWVGITIAANRPNYFVRRIGERDRSRLESPAAKSTLAFAASAGDDEVLLHRIATSAINMADHESAERLVFFVEVGPPGGSNLSLESVQVLAKRWVGRWSEAVSGTRTRVRTPDDFLQKEAWLNWANEIWVDWRFEAWVVVSIDYQWREATVYRTNENNKDLLPPHNGRRDRPASR